MNGKFKVEWTQLIPQSYLGFLSMDWITLMKSTLNSADGLTIKIQTFSIQSIQKSSTWITSGTKGNSSLRLKISHIIHFHGHQEEYTLYQAMKMERI